MQKSSFFKSAGIRAIDSVILLLFAGILAFSIYTLKDGNNREPVVIITAPGSEYIFPLNKDREVQIKGLIGISVIKIKDSQVYFEESPCPNKTCVASTPICGNFEWIACLPNQVFVRIEKNDDDQTGNTDVSSF